MVLEGEFTTDTRVKKEAEALIAYKHDVSIACSSIKKGLKDIEDISSVKVFRKRMPSFIYKSSVGCLDFPFYFKYWRKFLDAIITRNSFDVIHLHDIKLAKVCIALKNKYRLKLVIDCHENMPEMLKIAKHTNSGLGRLFFSYKKWTKYEKKVLAQADSAIVVVDEMKERILPYVSEKNKIYVVSNTIDLNEANKITATNNTDNIILFYSGSVTYHRGLQNVIMGLKKIYNTNPKVKLWIVGDGSYLNTLKKLAIKNGVNQIISFFGRLPHEKLLEKMMSSDVGLIPHIKSGQTDNSSPNKLFDYMFGKKPIIASNCNSIKRIIESEECGLTYLHDNPEDFAKKTIDLIKSPELMNKFANNGHIAVMKKYNWKTTSQSLIQLYNNL